MKAKSNILGSASALGAIASFSWPVMIGLFVSRAGMLADAAIVEHCCGSAGMAAVTVAMPWCSGIRALGMAVGDGYSAYAAVLVGEGKERKAARALGATLALLALLSAATALLLFPLAGAAGRLGGAEGAVADGAAAYLAVNALGLFPLSLTLGLSHGFRIVGRPRVPLYVMGLASGVNLLGDVVFVALGGWGVVGAALGTLAGNLAGGILAVALARPILRSWGFGRRDVRLAASHTREVVRFGSLSAAIHAGDALAILAANRVAVAMAATQAEADALLAALGFIARVADLMIIPSVGTAVAMKTLVGYSVGASNGPRVRKLVRAALAIGALLGLAIWALVQLRAPQIAAAFGFDGRAAPVAGAALRLAVLCAPLAALRVVATNLVQALGQRSNPVAFAIFQKGLYLASFLGCALGAAALIPGVPFALFGAMAVAEGASSLASCAAFARLPRMLGD